MAAGALSLAPRLAAISSPMRRCRETAEPYVSRAQITVAIEPRVSEVPSPSDVTDRRGWLRQNFPWEGGGSRSWRDMAPALLDWRTRLLGFVRELEQDSVVFTHFIAINTIVGASLDSSSTIVCKPAYASITELSVERSGLRLVQLGEEMRAGEVR